MKNHITRFFPVLLLLCALSSGCTNTLHLQVLQPADISISPDIQKLALVSRYRAEKGQGIWNVLEGAVTGEGIHQDLNGSQQCLEGLAAQLNASPRFSTTMPAMELRGSGLGVFPPPLPAEEVSSHCKTYGAQALVTIEAFDSDNRVTYTPFSRDVKKGNETVKVPMVRASQHVRITVGWRMYDGASGHLLDEYTMVQETDFRGEGMNELDALRHMPHKRDMVNQLGGMAGDAYARRISPNWIWVNREFYSKGTDDLKRARRLMDSKRWEEAEQIYASTEADGSLKAKIRGRGAHNAAVTREVQGDLEGAHQWASRAYSEYNNKRSSDYLRILEYRIQEQKALEEQMQGK